ncbi:MAG TPA: 3-phosphoshikimate 1-carboxyvinyltransferase [Aliidongia sp.]|uniref:3-phosphoshikimate 1-carboxyvinyltransferase n=1 Tax=Aliidongia sp. TaxID=1914230 RepID=UPI002DDD34E5|nr:3-phosphoshikimate 1-carboxyvinyltransferase [Aliidongia sp.]HEV2677242.1 3-phosphoshikimate 1-carboxyvinyltransferase [Aliidongia sp.]
MSPSTPLIARPGRMLAGTIPVPGDRVLSQCALILGALAVGRTSIRGLPDDTDFRQLAAALRALGAAVTRHDDGLWTVDGVGVGGLLEPSEILDLGDSGTALHLLMGLIASHPLTTIFTGTAALNRRPLARLLHPLERMGAQFVGRYGGHLPLAVVGAAVPMPIEHVLPGTGDPIKPAILLAGLNTPGLTSVVEPRPADDGLDRLLRRFGARIEVEPLADGACRTRIEGQPELVPATLDLPGDPLAAAFPIVAALTTGGSDVTLSHVGLDPARSGLLTILREMGAGIDVLETRDDSDGPAGTLRVRGSRLTGVTVPGERAADLLDYYPILAIAAAHATGPTVLPGWGDGDRLARFARALAICGVDASVEGGALILQGAGGPATGGARLPTDLDPDAALALLVLGLGARAPIEIADGAAIETCFPGFAGRMRELGADLTMGVV